MADVPRFEEVAQRVGHHDGAVFLGLPRRGAEVRQGHGPGMHPDGIRRKVTDVGAQLATVETGQHGGLVDDLAAGEIEHRAALAHERDTRLIDHSARVVGERHVHRHGIAAGEQVVQAERLFDARRELPRALHGDLRVVAQDLHAEMQGRVRDLDADGAEPDHAEGAPRQFVADELLLALLHRRFERVIVAFERAHVAPGLADVARRQEQACKHQLFHGVGVGAWRIEDGDTTRAQLGDGAVVGARPRPGPRQHARRNLDRVHVGRTDEQRIRPHEFGRNFVAVARQPLEAAQRDVVEGLDLEQRYPLVRWNSRMYSTSASTPAIGIAL